MRKIYKVLLLLKLGLFIMLYYIIHFVFKWFKRCYYKIFTLVRGSNEGSIHK